MDGRKHTTGGSHPSVPPFIGADLLHLALLGCALSTGIGIPAKTSAQAEVPRELEWHDVVAVPVSEPFPVLGLDYSEGLGFLAWNPRVPGVLTVPRSGDERLVGAEWVRRPLGARWVRLSGGPEVSLEVVDGLSRSIISLGPDGDLRRLIRIPDVEHPWLDAAWMPDGWFILHSSAEGERRSLTHVRRDEDSVHVRWTIQIPIKQGRLRLSVVDGVPVISREEPPFDTYRLTSRSQGWTPYCQMTEDLWRGDFNWRSSPLLSVPGGAMRLLVDLASDRRRWFHCAPRGDLRAMGEATGVFGFTAAIPSRGWLIGARAETSLILIVSEVRLMVPPNPGG